MRLIVDELNVHPMATVQTDDGDRISTGRVKRLLEVGDVRAANALLGRYYRVSGRVQHGHQRGSSEIVPTLNLTFARKHIPKFGVYACMITHGDARIL